MNAREWVEVESKKNNDFLSHPCYPVNCQCLSRKIPIKKEKKERKRKNTDTTQTKLNALHVRYNLKLLPQ